MIRIRDISMAPKHTVSQLSYEAAKVLRIPVSKVKHVRLVKRSIDARKKPDIRIIYTIDVNVEGNERRILRDCHSKKAEAVQISYYKVPKSLQLPDKRPVIIGFGPAGMFAGLILAMAGLRPLILERGEDALTRHKKVEHFFETGELDSDCNVQFGEGGAGTFSDGKLNTGLNNPKIHWVLEQFVSAGAQENILFDAKPHVGTDVLLKVVQNLRKRIQSLGGEICFRSHVTDFVCKDGHLAGVVLKSNKTIPCNQAILAIGHSARDTFETLLNIGIPLEAKPFSMGVRIEHKQSDIDQAQYGETSISLPPADYKLVKHLDDHTVYTFCMCPGGYVVAAASEENRCVTNGMSYSDRDGENANSALLVTLNPKDFPDDGPLSGMYWQRELEARAYQAGGGKYYAPVQRVEDFLMHRKSNGPGKVHPTYRPGVTWCDLHDVLPPIITDALEKAIPMLEGNLRGFSQEDSVLTAPETRSSSPVRILRNDNKESVGLKGLFPAGEGAGYAGGIMSAALDGIACAEAVISSLSL